MKKEIRTHTIRMTGAFMLLAALSLWQFDFVVVSINANIYLNTTIIGVFLFGVVLAYRGVLGLGTELLAFDALKEEYSDVRAAETSEEGDPNWRFNRCDKPAIVFSRPSILGQSYQLCSDEIGRTGDLQLTAGTMSTLVEGIDIRLDEQRSLLNYVTGILVMLGLIGTFVGLMGTLSSVGDIIGGLDLSGGAGTEVIQNLMTSLQAPLAGMATGFSSSLFGLITSLTLGLMTRFNSQALNVVRMTFETWLGGVAQIEASASEGTTASNETGGAGLETDEKRLLFRVARQTVTSTARLSDLTESLIGGVADLKAEQAENRDVVHSLTRHMAELSANQDRFAISVDQVARTLATQADLQTRIRAMEASQAEHRARVELTMNESARLASQTLSTQASINKRLSDVSEVMVEQGQAISHIATLDETVMAGFAHASRDLLQIDTRLQGVESRVGSEAAESDPNQTERHALISQIDHLIAINRLSDEDSRGLKQLARLYRESGITEECLKSALDMVIPKDSDQVAEGHPLPAADPVTSESHPQQPAEHETERPSDQDGQQDQELVRYTVSGETENDLDEKFRLFDPGYDVDSKQTG